MMIICMEGPKMAKRPKTEVVQKIKPETITLEIIPSIEPKLGRVYSNYIQISHSPWDFTIRFADAPSGSDAKELKQGIKLKIPTVVDVVVVPTLIPGLIQALEANYKKYLEENLKTEEVEVD